jgi:hypothetical protein
MSSKLYELVTNPNTKLNDDFINESFDLMINKEEGLEKYISDFLIDNSISCLGSYSPIDKVILINEKLINNTPRLYDPKIFALSVIRHEMEHARNLKRVYEGGNDIESTVVRYSLIDYIQQNGLYSPFGFQYDNQPHYHFKKKSNYEFDPEERIADIKSNKYIVNLLKNQRTSRDLLVARSFLYYAYIRGYKDNRYYLEPPTYTYLMNMEMYRDYYLLKRIVDNNNYSLYTRVLLGLPITYNEKESALLRKARLQRRK